MGFDGGNLLNYGDEFGGGGGGGGGGGDVETSAEVCCSICLDAVTDDGKRSWAKLQCNHQFHLDCIGSAFNAKGVMQCPNCRKIEKGQWLYAKGSHSRPDNMFIGNPIPVEDLNLIDSTFPEWYMNFGSALSPSPYDEGGPPIAARLHEERRHLSSPSPRAAFLAPFDIIDDVAVMMLEQRNSIPISSSRHILRSGGGGTTTYSDRRQQQQGSVMQQPFVVDHRSGSSVTTSRTTRVQPNYPGSIARFQDRVEALEAYHQQLSDPGFTRASGGITSSGSFGRSNGQNYFGIPNLPPILSQTNHAANRLPLVSSSEGGRVYHDLPRGSGVYEAARVRSPNPGRRRYRTGGRQMQSQNRW